MELLAELDNISLWKLKAAKFKQIILEKNKYYILYLYNDEKEDDESFGVIKWKNLAKPLNKQNLIWLSTIEKESTVEISCSPQYDLRGKLFSFSMASVDLIKTTTEIYAVLISVFDSPEFIESYLPNQLQQEDFEVIKNNFDNLQNVLVNHATASSTWKRVSAMSISINLLSYILMFQKRKTPINKVKKANELNIVHKFIMLIDQNYMHNYSLDFYTQSLDLKSVRQLSAIVKKTLKASPKEIINHKIVSEAKKRLRLSNLTIKDISASMGFKDPSNFNKFFIKYAAMTPKVFRELKV